MRHIECLTLKKVFTRYLEHEYIKITKISYPVLKLVDNKKLRSKLNQPKKKSPCMKTH